MKRFLLVMAVCITTGAAPASRLAPWVDRNKWAIPDISQSPIPATVETEQPPQVTDKTTIKPKEDERGTEKSPLVARVILPPKSQQETSQDAEDRREKASADRWTILLTGALAFIGFVQTIVFSIQAYRLKETVIAMKEIDGGQTAKVEKSIAQATRAATAMENVAEHMGRSVQAAFDNANAAAEGASAAWAGSAAAGRTAEIMENTAKRQLRAYLGPSSQQKEVQTFNSPRVNIIVKNYGQTPASSVRAWSGIDVREYPLTTLLPDTPPLDTVIVESIIHPGDHVTLMNERRQGLTPPEKTQIQDGRTAIYVWGRITYKDVFDEPHATNFRYVIIGSEALEKGIISISEHGNDFT